MLESHRLGWQIGFWRDRSIFVVLFADSNRLDRLVPAIQSDNTWWSMVTRYELVRITGPMPNVVLLLAAAHYNYFENVFWKRCYACETIAFKNKWKKNSRQLGSDAVQHTINLITNYFPCSRSLRIVFVSINGISEWQRYTKNMITYAHTQTHSTFLRYKTTTTTTFQPESNPKQISYVRKIEPEQNKKSNNTKDKQPN